MNPQTEVLFMFKKRNNSSKVKNQGSFYWLGNSKLQKVIMPCCSLLTEYHNSSFLSLVCSGENIQFALMCRNTQRQHERQRAEVNQEWYCPHGGSLKCNEANRMKMNWVIKTSALGATQWKWSLKDMGVTFLEGSGIECWACSWICHGHIIPPLLIL